MADNKSPVELNTNKVDTPLPAYDDFMEVLAPLDTLMKGTRGMQEASTTYLPQEAEEDPIDYSNRLKRTKLVNYFKRTIQKLAGEVFSKPLTRSDDINETVDEILDDVDNNGHDITEFAFKSFQNGLHKGVVHFLVDYPQVRLKKEGNVTYFLDENEKDPERKWKPWTRANERELNYRPNWVHIDADQIIGWRTEVKQGKVTLTQIRIRETTEEPDGEYGQKDVNRIRVFTQTNWEVHKQNDEGVYEPESSGTNNLGYVPLVTVYLGEKIREMVVDPPLESLGDLNILHWQSTSDQRNILHYARLVIYFGKMMDTTDGKMVVGPNRFVLSDEPEADLKVVEHNGRSIEAGRQDIKDLETQMALFGLSLMLPKTGNTTATERALDSAENDSTLKSWALALQRGINECIEITADYLQIEREKAGTISINTEFKSFVMGVESKLLLDAADKNIIPKAVVVDEFIRRGILKEDTDPLELETMLEKERQQSMSFMESFNSARTRQPNTGGEMAPNEPGMTEDE